MKAIKDEDEKTHDRLMKKGHIHWSKEHFRTTIKCDISLNNLCESFNSTSAIKVARERPILGYWRGFILDVFGE